MEVEGPQNFDLEERLEDRGWGGPSLWVRGGIHAMNPEGRGESGIGQNISKRMDSRSRVLCGLYLLFEVRFDRWCVYAVRTFFLDK